MKVRAAAVLAAVFLLSACAPAPPPADRLALTPASFARLAGWADDAHAAAIAPLRRSCARLARAADERAVGPQAVGGRVKDWRAPCTAAERLAEGDDAAARAFFERHFVPFRASGGGKSQGLFTGYYEAELHGARNPSKRYNVPIYGLPQDLVTVDLGEFRVDLKGRRIAGRVVGGRLRPYHDRARIDAGELKGRTLTIVWVDDPIDAFFLHIQGSGRVILVGGGVMRVGYAGRNGRPYFSIGRELIRRGELSAEGATMQSIRAWLKAHPDEAGAVMAKNTSYIFFRELDGQGPVGAAGVPLTPGRSLAVDRKFIPLGVPVWLDAADPARPDERLRRLLIAQDTGAAIKGPVRGDVFWGFGAQAAERAGRMRSLGEYYLLLPLSAAQRRLAAR